MPDLILRNIEPAMLERVQRLADARGWSIQQALLCLLDRGLASSSAVEDPLEGFDTRVLEEALIAMENVPSDPGFALIGRAAPSPPSHDAPDQAIAPRWTPPKVPPE